MNLEGYEFIDKISNDTNSETWTARKQNTEQTVVIKVLNRNTVTPNHYKMIIENANKAKDHRHTNIIALHDIEEQDELTYFISDNISGETVSETVKRSGVLDEEMALMITLCITGMLDMTHRKDKLSHGHISPSNIIINEEGIIKLVGLGIPFDIHANSFFKAPEQDANKAPNLASDMYSIGAIIYYMLTAKTNFSEVDNSSVATLSNETSELVTKFTHTNPNDRYTTWQDAITDIEKAVSASGNTDSTQNIATAPSVKVAVASSVKIASTPNSPLVAPSSPTATPNVKIATMPKVTTAPTVQPSEAVTPIPIIAKNTKQDKPAKKLKLKKQALSNNQPDSQEKSKAKKLVKKKTYTSKSKKKAKVPPQRFRNIAWLLLLGFLAWFAYKQMTSPLTIVDTLLAKVQNLTSSNIAPQVDGTTTPEQTEDTPIQEVPASILDDVKNQVATYVLANNIPEAKMIISQSTAPEVKEQASTLIRFINDITNADTYIANNFRQRIGQTTVIMFGDVRREIILSSVSGLSITAKLVGDSEPVIFNLKELPAGEKLRLLESQGDAVASSIKLLLNMKLGNINEAKILASSCGPLSNAFVEQLKTK